MTTPASASTPTLTPAAIAALADIYRELLQRRAARASQTQEPIP